MGKVLLTLYYHPDEKHAFDVCRRLEHENLDGTVLFPYSTPNSISPDPLLQQKAVELGCGHVLTVHDSLLDPLQYALYIFSRKKLVYRAMFKQLSSTFNQGTYGFETPYTEPVQIDLELNERNDPETSVEIVKKLIDLLSSL